MVDTCLKWDVFCIHASADKELARQFRRGLNSACHVFLDEEELFPGADWRYELDSALQSCRIFTVFVTQNLATAHYANEEITTALELHRHNPHHRRIVPLVWRRTGDVSRDMPYGLRGIQGIDVAAVGVEGAVKHVRGLLDEIPGTAPKMERAHAADTVDEPRHVLKTFPRGPFVPPHRVPASITHAFAELIRASEARQLVSTANRFRQEADANDRTVTLIQQFRLREPATNAAIDFWTDVFVEAGRHGPRMLAALLLSLEDQEFPDQARQDRHTLLDYLRNPTE